MLQGTVDGGAVVEAFGEADNLRTHEYIGTADGLFQLDAFQRGAAAEGYVCLPTGKHAAGKVDDYPAEGQPLALVDGDGPCQAHGILCKGSQFFLFNLFLFFVVFVADVSPRLSFDVTFLAVVGDDVEGLFNRVEAADDADGAVHPAAVEVILDEDDLCARFQYQFLRGGEAAFGKVSHDFAVEGDRVTGKFRQFFVVDVVHIVTAGGEGDVHVGFRLLYLGAIAGVEQLKFGRADGIVADVVQHMDELAVCLPVYFLQFDGDKVYLAEYPGREEIRGRVESVQYLPFISFDDGFQLEHIAHQ